MKHTVEVEETEPTKGEFVSVVVEMVGWTLVAGATLYRLIAGR